MRTELPISLMPGTRSTDLSTSSSAYVELNLDMFLRFEDVIISLDYAALKVTHSATTRLPINAGTRLHLLI